jgi:stalled ribosome alternative rescue factor ArfA
MRKERKLSASAKALADRKYHQRIVLAKKGRGSYNRKKMENVNA